MNNEILLYLDSIKSGLKMLSDKYQNDLTSMQINSLVYLALISIETKNDFIKLKIRGEK